MIKKKFFKTKNDVEVTFEIDGHGAKSVDISADFLNWQPEPMKKVPKTTHFKFKTRLPKDSQFEFRYCVNGYQWINDEQADGYIPNIHGEDNCLLLTKTA